MDRRNPFQHHHHHHQLHHHLIQQQQQLPPPPPPQSTSTAIDPGGGGGERVPQWSIEETKELLGIREELDQTFMETKRNKLLWEVVAAKMADKGFSRSSEQCKSKWKNLVTRYKACETTEPEAIRQVHFPFYNEIQSIFAERMQRMLWSEATEPSTSTKRKHNQLSSEDDEEEEEETEEPNQDINAELLSLVETHKKDTEVMINPTTSPTNPRKRVKKGKGNVTKADQAATGSSIKELLEEFMKQTVKMEKEWREAWEMKEREREKREIEWRRRMAELEEERAATERRWIEREEERRLREEARAQKRDTLIDALINKLNNDHHQGF